MAANSSSSVQSTERPIFPEPSAIRSTTLMPSHVDGFADGVLPDDPFTFDGLFDFPLTPNPSLPTQSGLFPPSFKADIDAVLGLSVGPSMIDDGVYPEIIVSEPAFESIDPWSSAQTTAAPPQADAMSLEALLAPTPGSHLDTASGVREDGRKASRDTVLDTIRQLVSLASTMHP